MKLFHLPDSIEQPVRIQLDEWDEAATFFERHVGQGVFHIGTPQVLRVGTRFLCRLFFPNGKNFVLRAQVVQVIGPEDVAKANKPVGFGFTLLPLTQAEAEPMQTLLATLERTAYGTLRPAPKRAPTRPPAGIPPPSTSPPLGSALATRLPGTQPPGRPPGTQPPVSIPARAIRQTQGPLSALPTASTASTRSTLTSTTSTRSTLTSVPTAAPVEERASIETSVASFQRELATIRTQSPLAQLGLGRNAEAPDVRSAFLRLTRQWHPTRYMFEAEEVQRLAEEIFITLKATYQALLEPGRLQAARAELAPPMPGELASGTSPPTLPPGRLGAIAADIQTTLGGKLTATKQAPPPPHPEWVRAEALAKAGNFAEARKCLEYAIKASPPNPLMHERYRLIAAREAIAAKNYDAASRHLRKALEVNKDCTVAMEWLRQLRGLVRSTGATGLAQQILAGRARTPTRSNDPEK